MEVRTSDQLAAFVTALRYEDLPTPVVTTARRIFLDDLGSILGGFCEPEVAALGTAVAGSASGRTSTLLGAGFPRVAPAEAVLVNGTANCGLETDGGYRYASCHASSCVLPTALALAEATGADGPRLVEALVAGYEVAARLAAATALRRPMLPHGVWSAPGAAAAAARLLGLDRARTAAAIDLAAALTGNAAFTGRFEGATVRNVYNGVGGRTGLFAAALARSGVTAGFDTIARVFGSMSGIRLDEGLAATGVGGAHAISFHYHKRWPCCGFVHASLDAIADLMMAEPIDPAAVARIEIATFPEGAVLNDRAPLRPLAARHSVPWAAASLIVRGQLVPGNFADGALADPKIRALASVIDVCEDDTLPSGFSNHRSARVRVLYRNGRNRTHTCDNVQGDFSTPFPESLLREKFSALAEPVLGASTGHIADTMLAVDELTDVRTLTAAIAEAAVTAADGAARKRTEQKVATAPRRRTDAPAWLDKLCAAALARPSQSAIAAARAGLAATQAAIERTWPTLVASGAADGEGRIRLQGTLPEARALHDGFSAVMAAEAELSAGHVAILVAAMASGAAEIAGVDRIAEAAAAGLQVAAALSSATTLREGYSETGIWGVLGAAAASGLVQRFDGPALAQALNVAASLTLAAPAEISAPSLAAAVAGEAAYRGVLAARLVRAGYDGLRDGVGFILDEFAAAGFDRAALHLVETIPT
jgi:2-methylcitrate dehydratase PrpD